MCKSSIKSFDMTISKSVYIDELYYLKQNVMPNVPIKEL